MKPIDKIDLPALRICQTVGGYFRVYIHGVDSIQDNGLYAMMDIGRGPTKEVALAQAWEWYQGMRDDCPKMPPLLEKLPVDDVDCPTESALLAALTAVQDEFIAKDGTVTATTMIGVRDAIKLAGG